MLNWRNRARWVTAGVLVLGLTAGCGSGVVPGAPAGSGSSPEGVLNDAAKEALTSGSSRVKGSVSFRAGGQPMNFDGVLSWSTGFNGELTMANTGSVGPTVIRFTDDAMYSTMPAELREMTAGKSWGKYSYADVARNYGPMGELMRAAFTRTFPARSAAMLTQSGDLRLVGEEQRNGVATKHYSGTIELSKLVADLDLGLSDEVLAQLRKEFQSYGVTSERLDIWLDERDYPVRVEARSGDPARGETTATADYSDYGGPRPISAPPADQVFDLNTLMTTPPR